MCVCTTVCRIDPERPCACRLVAARRGISLGQFFEELDEVGDGEIDAAHFVQGVQRLDGALSEREVERLMQLIDTDSSGTVDFNELSRGLLKLDLRVELSEYYMACCRFYCAEMARSASLLRGRFVAAANAAGTAAASAGQSGAGAEGAPAGSPKKRLSAASAAAKSLDSDGVRALLRQLDAPFPSSVVSRMLMEMREGSPKAQAPRRSEKEARVLPDDFTRVCLAYGFHAINHAFFRDAGSDLRAATLAAKSAKRLAALKKSSD